MSITSQEEALRVAKGVMARVEEMSVTVRALEDDDMLGLECSGTVQLEKLAAANAADAVALASWIVRSSVTSTST